MEIKNNSNRLHPLIAVAAIAVLLACLVGIAAMTGMLPNSNSSPNQAEVAALEREAELKAAEEKAAVAEAEAKAAAERAAQLRKEEERRVAAAKPAPRANDKPAKPAVASCSNCGRVESVHTVQTAAKPSGVGVVGGAVVGGLLGNQIGGGSGRSIATVAGAVGGGYAGNEIEKRSRTATTYQVRVRMEDGQLRTFPYNNPPPWGNGDQVRVVDGYLRAR